MMQRIINYLKFNKNNMVKMYIECNGLTSEYVEPDITGSIDKDTLHLTIDKNDIKIKGDEVRNIFADERNAIITLKNDVQIFMRAKTWMDELQQKKVK